MVRDEVAAVRALSRAARLLERASPELSPAHYRVLSAIAEGDGRGSRVARRLALGKPAVSSAVEALRARGLLERVAHDDQRVVALRLTPAGEDLLRETEAAMSDRLREVLGSTPAPHAVLDGLVALGDAIEGQYAARAEP